MNRLPVALYNRCRNVLLQCDEFQSNETLKACINLSPLQPYANSIPQSNRSDQRVDNCLDYLGNRTLNGQPALVLLLETLSNRYPEGDDLHAQLEELTRDVRTALSSAINQPAPAHQPANPDAIEVFYSYADTEKDEAMLKELLKHLATLRRQGYITDWYSGKVATGDRPSEELISHLDSAQIILLLISPDYVSSDELAGFQARRAMQRASMQGQQRAIVIPLLLRSIDNWENEPFGVLQAIPRNGKPISKWSDRDEAFAEVAREIRTAVATLRGAKPLAQQVRLAGSDTPAQPASPAPAPPAPTLFDRRETPSSSAPTTADVGIIFALEEEFREIFRQFAGNYIPVRDEETDNYYYQFQYPAAGTTSRYRCITTFVGGMGPVKAGIITEKLFSKWKPRLLVILGVAAALDDDVKLGDVVVADQVNMYLENSKAVPTGGGEDFTFQLSPESYRSSHDVLSLVQHLEFAHQKNFLDWQKHGATELQQLPAQEQIAALAHQGAIHEQPEVHVGHVASGSSVGAALAFKSWLRKQDRKYLALEMETGGFMEAVYQRTNLLHQQISPATLVLRAISDPGDENKKSLDNISKGIFRAYSLHNAIRLLWSILDTGFLPLS